MVALQMKVKSFLDDIEDMSNPTDTQRQEAIQLLTRTLRQRKKHLCRSRDELARAAERLKRTNKQLIDMNRRLELAKKAGLVSKSIH